MADMIPLAPQQAPSLPRLILGPVLQQDWKRYSGERDRDGEMLVGGQCLKRGSGITSNPMSPPLALVVEPEKEEFLGPQDPQLGFLDSNPHFSFLESNRILF